MTFNPPWPHLLLEDRVLVLAGAGPGLGAQIARDAAAAGAKVMLAARTEAYLKQLSTELAGAGADVAYQACDVTVSAECEDLMATAEERFGGVDCVVCNAFASGRAYGLTLEEADVDDWRDAFDVNVFGSLRVVKAAIPRLKTGGGGSVIFIGSQIVRRVFVGRGPYAASKAALLTAAQVLARELGPFGIRVNTVVPGRMWGPSLLDYIERLAVERGTSFDQELGRMVGDVALPKLSTDEESARVVVFLASALAAGMTGQSLDVNAGETFH
jgi:NAD(P)-dependent dehydrogenase (short-subunit alcohol dehydrogenase family)